MFRKTESEVQLDLFFSPEELMRGNSWELLSKGRFLAQSFPKRSSHTHR